MESRKGSTSKAIGEESYLTDNFLGKIPTSLFKEEIDKIREKREKAKNIKGEIKKI